MTYQSRLLVTSRWSRQVAWVGSAAYDMPPESQDQPSMPPRYNRPHRGGYCPDRQDQPAGLDLSRPKVSESPFRKPKPRAKGIGWSRSNQQGRCVRDQQITIEAEGPTRFGSSPAGSLVSARDGNRCALARRRCAADAPRALAAPNHRLGSTHQSARPPNAALPARLLGNKTTRPIHLDMNRAPTTTFAGRPYNALPFSCKPAAGLAS